jgi:hypothetical protein
VVLLPSNLHLTPHLLRQRLEDELAAAKGAGVPLVLLYGDCFTDVDRFCAQTGVVKVEGVHCYEMLLGAGRFKAIIDRSAGTFFAERLLLRDFESLCLRPLELDDPELRGAYFAHYRRLIYLRQPQDPDLRAKAAEVAELLGLDWEIAEADYRHLEVRLRQALDRAQGGDKP